MNQNVVEANRERDLYLKELADDMDLPSGNVVFIPQGWCDEFTIANGFAGGPDDVEDEPCLYGWIPLTTDANSEVHTGWYPIEALQQFPEITEQEAREIHPRMFERFAELNAE